MKYEANYEEKNLFWNKIVYELDKLLLWDIECEATIYITNDLENI